MKIFLAGTNSCKQALQNVEVPYVLESFYYFKEWQLELVRKAQMFLLDSGAFTFMQNCGRAVDWDRYIDAYGEFINQNKIDYFFELDIDSVVGYEKVKTYRNRLEKITNKKCIPVWHRARGKNEHLKLCDEYDYVSIGGIVSKEFKITDWKYFPWFINEAHRRGCAIHGLGFTSNNGLKKYKFDTVDSTAWASGSRFGTLYQFRDGNITTIQKADNQRGKSEELTEHNLKEWIKFQKYAERFL